MEFDTRDLLEENLRISKENNRLLRKIRRTATYGLIFKILWIAVLIGAPVAFYVYVILPYYSGLQVGFEQFRLFLENIPGLNLLLEKMNVQNIRR